MANIDAIVMKLVTTDDVKEKDKCLGEILAEADKKGVFLASIHDFYVARSKGAYSGLTVPAINLRSLTYDLARAIFRVANRIKSGTFIFEIAKSEMGYTDQRPSEYTGVCLAAAIKENYSGPVFIQGDHFQANAKKFAENKTKEIEGLKTLIREAVSHGFYNIDIDSSTLVDLSQKDPIEEQRNNFEVCATLTKYIREIEPKGITISVGGEIGEVGKQNSTPEELAAFMKGYNDSIGKGTVGISKISIQTGTSHGGVVLPDGSIAKVKLDFNTLKVLSEEARKKYGMAGAVQHGASTLPDDAFNKFPEMEAAEVHLATQFQNMIYESEHFPAELRERMYKWLHENCASEKKDGQTEDQFIYKTRKKALGAFKKEIYGLPQKTKDVIAKEVEEKFEFLFKKLNIGNTKDVVSKYIKKTDVPLKREVGAHLDGEGDD